MLNLPVVKRRHRTLLCLGVSTLLAACGGGNADAPQAGSGKSNQLSAMVQASSANLALNKATTASSIENTSLGPAGAVDERAWTRWASARSDAEWMQVDLGAAMTITSVSLSWETAYAKAYLIQTSTDNSSWATVYSTSAGKGGTETPRFAATTARFVRMQGVKRASEWGYSLYEFLDTPA